MRVSGKALFALLLGSALAAEAAGGVQFFDASDTAHVPKLLSGTGIYISLSAKTADTALKYFEVNAPLWSDAAHKQRWIILPPGKKVVYNDTTDYFGYPDSTIFVKNFLHDAIEGDSGSRVYWETRLLVNKKVNGRDDWHGFSYKWNATSTEAHLVSLQSGFDTVFIATVNGVQQYRKWRFPAQGLGCQACHLRGTTEMDGETVPVRGVLGFFPAQLKRQATGNPSTNQLNVLFASGVFAGSLPAGANLTRRWKGFSEGIPGGLTPEQRFRVIDTMARAYLAANCSGCHGKRQFDASYAPLDLNFDFHTLVPQGEFGNQTVARDVGLADQSGSEAALQDGGFKFLRSVQRAGFSTAPGAIWDMTVPPDAGARLVSPGVPAMSMLLYRQFAMRNTPWRDSLALRARLAASDPGGWSAWIFARPWGTKAWRDTLAARGVALNAVITYESDGTQMPLLATYIPDTAAMRVLGEWVDTYRPHHPASVRGTAARAGAAPRLVNGMLWVPESWTGRVTLSGLNGRAWTLASVGRGRYAIPASVPSGLYFARAGEHKARVSVLR